MTFEQEVINKVKEVLANPNYTIETKTSKLGNYLVMFKNSEADRWSTIEIEDNELANKVKYLINPVNENTSNNNEDSHTTNISFIIGGKHFYKGVTAQELINELLNSQSAIPKERKSVRFIPESVGTTAQEVLAKLPKFVKAKEKTNVFMYGGEKFESNYLTITINPTNGQINETGWKRINKFLEVTTQF